MQRYLKGQLASFSFAHVGESAYPAKTLLGLPLTNISHYPRLPVPPGIGVFFTQFQNRLNLTISYLENMLTEEESLTIKNNFSKRLLGDF